MAWSIVKQPNGKLARFSNVIDDFTHVDMTELEAVELCREQMSHDDANAKVRAGIDDIKYWTKNEKGTGHDRWDDCIATIANVHGQAKAADLIDSLTDK